MSTAIRLIVALCAVLVLTVGLGGAAVAAPSGNGSDPVLNRITFLHQADEAAAQASPVKPAKPAKEWYKYSGIHWDDSAIPVHYVIGGTDNSDFVAGIVASFETWEADGLSYIEFTCDNTCWTAVPSSFEGSGYTNGFNEVGWASLSSSYPHAIAVTMIWYGRDKHIVEVDTALNSDLQWTQNEITGDPNTAMGTPGFFDVQDIMTHEAGHWLMLLDLYQKAASEQTMYGYGSTSEVKARSLESGDIAGLRKIYPGAQIP